MECNGMSRWRRISALFCLMLFLPAFGRTESLPEAGDLTLLVLASPASPLQEGYEPQELTTVRSRRSDEDGNNINGGVRKATSVNMQLEKEAYSALTLLFDAAETEGVILYIRQGYRSYADQEERYLSAEKRGDTSGIAKAGETDYQTGLAATVVSKEWRAKTLTEAFAQTEEYQWIAANCSRFGFIIRYPEWKEDITGANFEPWHLRYVGKDAAQYITANGLCLEEYCELLGGGAGAEPLMVETIDLEGEDGEAEEEQTEESPESMPIADVLGPDGDYEISLFGK